MKKIERKKTLFKSNSQMSNRNITINNNINDCSSVQLTPYNTGKKYIFKNNFNSIVNNNKFKFIKDENNLIINKYYNKMKIERQSNNSLVLDENTILNKNIKNIDFFKNKKNDISNLSFNNKKKKKYYSLHNYENQNNNILSNNKPKTHYIKKTLFPYRYYLYSIFYKNVDTSKKPFFFTKKFTIVYNFICQLFDISSYLILQREFQTMKNTIIEEKQRK